MCATNRLRTTQTHQHPKQSRSDVPKAVPKKKVHPGGAAHCWWWHVCSMEKCQNSEVNVWSKASQADQEPGANITKSYCEVMCCSKIMVKRGAVPISQQAWSGSVSGCVGEPANTTSSANLQELIAFPTRVRLHSHACQRAIPWDIRSRHLEMN